MALLGQADIGKNLEKESYVGEDGCNCYLLARGDGPNSQEPS